MLKITAPVLSVGVFAKTWWRETIKKTVDKRYQFKLMVSKLLYLAILNLRDCVIIIGRGKGL